jgi:2'-5' RNA ligase
LKAFIYLEIPKQYHSFFPSDRGGDDDSLPHCTLFFLENLGKNKLKVVSDILLQLSQRTRPIRASFGQLECFSASQYGCPWYVEILDLFQDISMIRSELKRAFIENGIDCASKHKTYTPHATLKYLPEGSIYTGTLPSGQFQFTEIFLNTKD